MAVGACAKVTQREQTGFVFEVNVPAEREQSHKLQPPIGILKSLWSRGRDGRWGVTDIKGLSLAPKSGFQPDYFASRREVSLLTTTPSANFHEMSASFGTTDFLMRQSIVPVVAWKNGDVAIRCIGTAVIISCSGYLITAAHVIIDPYERNYGLSKVGTQLKPNDDLNFGVFIPVNPAFAQCERFFPFEKYWVWGKWKKKSTLHGERQVRTSDRHSHL